MRVPCDTGMRFAHIPYRNTVEALLAWHPQMARGPRLHRNRSGIRIDVSGARPMVLFDSHPRIARTRARRHRIVGTLFQRWPSHPTHSVHRHRFDACRAHHRLQTGVHPHRGIRHHPPMAANPNPRYPVHPFQTRHPLHHRGDSAVPHHRLRDDGIQHGPFRRPVRLRRSLQSHRLRSDATACQSESTPVFRPPAVPHPNRFHEGIPLHHGRVLTG